MSKSKSNSLLFALAVLALVGGCTTTLPAKETRAAPAMAGMAPSARCPDLPERIRDDVCALVEPHARDRLKALPGARVYRETWYGPFLGPMHGGQITLTIYPSGRRTLQTPWRVLPYWLKPNELSGFEAAIAASDFGRLPVYNRANLVCIDGVGTSLEAIVGDAYRLTYFDFCGGVSSESVAAALDDLFVFAADLSGKAYPVNPDHPTFRGR